MCFLKMTLCHAESSVHCAVCYGFLAFLSYCPCLSGILVMQLSLNHFFLLYITSHSYFCKYPPPPHTHTSFVVSAWSVISFLIWDEKIFVHFAPRNRATPHSPSYVLRQNLLLNPEPVNLGSQVMFPGSPSPLRTSESQMYTGAKVFSHPSAGFQIFCQVKFRDTTATSAERDVFEVSVF